MKNNQPLVIANWKLNGGTDLICASVASVLQHDFCAQIGIAPPYVYISDMANFLRNSKIMIGSQNVSKFESGAFTGETSAQMLKEVGCEFCIIGHSERRQVFLENNASCKTKIKRALKAGLMPVVCIGENLQQHQLGLTKDILYRQLNESFGGLDLTGCRVCIAYEPIWAIGSGKAASAEMVADIHTFIYQELTSMFDADIAGKIQILYGGSVNKHNAGEFLNIPHVSGLLVGGASLEPEHFAEICVIASQNCATD
ncbi:triose-phosphate isomerase [Catenovulum sp. 2E275]|uniref:triose-phosphate isomerase n=1 Tax=Catenovulum sp. 2E275 TaxID=2980497 RepID=UPI0021D08A93|nr:triose-phosphate isomerase [Catenovulum sp. 2E275]MCU4674144.1 triose-phosphate isomerase [Catenovulum sp. 2E275]